MKTYVIGAGGVGSWLVPALRKLEPERTIAVVDGDVLEEKNLDRQLFNYQDIGVNKAQALSAKYGCEAWETWYYHGLVSHYTSDLIHVCADNHAARSEAIKACDFEGCSAIISCNETTSAEAFYYRSEWKGTPMDPRVYYPEIESDRSGDPRAAAMGCVEAAAAGNTQLVSANLMAAALALHLHVVWRMYEPTMESQAKQHLPHRLSQTLSRFDSYNAIKEPTKDKP